MLRALYVTPGELDFMSSQDDKQSLKTQMAASPVVDHGRGVPLLELETAPRCS